MSETIESSGDIEIFCSLARSANRGTVPFFDRISVGDRLCVVFVPGENTVPPFQLKVVSPSGVIILDTLVRDAPTGAPQSPSPIEFVVSAMGVYRIEVRTLTGRQRGEAKVRVG
jgi:hypothetical protein